MNSRGQLGQPIKETERENKYIDLNLVHFEVFKNNKLNIIDIAAGSYHTMFLVEPSELDPSIESEQRQVFV